MTVEQKPTWGVILPHTKIFGGVKRFFEIGNILIPKGYRFVVLTPEGKAPDWFEFKGEVVALTTLNDYTFEALFITEPDYLQDLKKANARLRIFYAVLQRRYIKKVVADKDLLVLANSSSLYKYLDGARKENVIKCVGGIDAEKFSFKPHYRHPGDPFVILAYGRFYRRKKGTNLVVRACESLYKKGYNLKLFLFDTPVDEAARKKVQQFRCKVPFEFFVDYPVDKVADLYHKADLFISAERNAGWSNTSAEAMACGVPVIATRSGTEDFLIHGETGLVVWRHPWFIKRAMKRLLDDMNLRHVLASNARRQISAFTWSSLAASIEGVVNRRLGGPA